MKVRFRVFTLSDSLSQTHQQTNVQDFMQEDEVPETKPQITQSKFLQPKVAPQTLEFKADFGHVDGDFLTQKQGGQLQNIIEHGDSPTAVPKKRVIKVKKGKAKKKLAPGTVIDLDTLNLQSSLDEVAVN